MLMLGRRGVGKSHLSIQAILDCGFKVNYINLSVLDCSDLAGFPSMFDKSDIITYKSPYFLPPLKEGQKPNQVILFDEVDKAPHELQGPLLEILQYRRINGKPLNAVACLLTGNLLEEGAYSHQISSALLDRCSKYILSFDLYQWLNWAKLHGVHDLILGFLISHPDHACGDIESTLLATPSPRGWTRASEAMIKAREHKITDIGTITQIIAGHVGANAALAFQTWYEYSREYEKIMPGIIEHGHSTLDFSKLDPTQQLIFAITLCHLAKHKVLGTTIKKKIRYVEHVCRFFTDNNVSKEIQFVSILNAFPFDLITKHKLYQSTVFFDLVSKLQEGVKISK